jgi:phenylalanine-4-hydroxylase
MLDLQRTYFILDDFNELHNLAQQDFFERALRLENLPILSKEAICPSDEIIQLGKNNQCTVA